MKADKVRRTDLKLDGRKFYRLVFLLPSSFFIVVLLKRDKLALKKTKSNLFFSREC